MATETLPNYAPVIRAQIERDVARLKRSLEDSRFSPDVEPVESIRAEYVELGYLLNTHHGQAIYAEGDLICGLPVRLGKVPPRTISVCADNVLFERQVEVCDEDGDMTFETETYRENLYKETSW